VESAISIDLEMMQPRLIVYAGMLAHPRLIAMLLNMLAPQDREQVRQMRSFWKARRPLRCTVRESRNRTLPGFARILAAQGAPLATMRSGEIIAGKEDWNAAYLD
jgi:hypothetical protein